MKVKIFQSENSFLIGKIGSSPIETETAINNFLKDNKIKKIIQIVQSSTYGDDRTYTTTSIFY